MQVSQDRYLPNTLNLFARFEKQQGRANPAERTQPEEEPTLTRLQHQVRSTLKRTDHTKAAGPDGVTGCLLRPCTDQPPGVYINSFNLSRQQPAVPTCLKSTTIIPVPKKSAVATLNDYCPVALTPVMMKYFERMVLAHIKNIIPADLD